MLKEPKTLQEVVNYFTDEQNCLDYLVAKRWPNGVVCPICSSTKVGFLHKQKRWQCSNKHPRRQFSVKVGTIFEDSPLGLDKWLPVTWLIVNCKNGVSSCEIHRDIGVTQKTAWFMLHRIRLAVQDEKYGGKLGGEVEVDETYIGGKARNMHSDRKKRALEGRGGGKTGKVGVQGMLERGGKIRTAIIEDGTGPTLRKNIRENIRENIEKGAHLFTDEAQAYFGLSAEYAHDVINHAEAYVIGNIHTNGLENFWALLKRGLKGTYVSVEPFHLFRYVDEQAFRYNNRKPMNDGERFSYAIRKIVGKRLTYAELTGKTLEAGPTAEEPF